MFSNKTALFLPAMAALALSAAFLCPFAKAGDKDDLPLAGTITWDVRAFEQSKDAFTLVKRTTSGTESVSWLLQINSDAEANRLIFYNSAGLYHAVFCDEDGATLVTVLVLPNTLDVRNGERIRYTLRMPSEEILAKTKSVIIKVR